MQRYCTELTERLLKSLDKEYNVVDMGAVVDVITALEKTTITKEVLEVTRLGKHINELRRKTNNDALAKRAKDLVRRWRDMVLPASHPTPQPTLADTAPQALNGTKPQSPALRGLKPHSPATIRALKPHSPAFKASLKPHSPLLRDPTTLKQVVSPASSLHSDHSRSPSLPTSRHHHSQQQGSLSSLSTASTTTATSITTNHRMNTDVTSKLGLTSTHNHTFEAVPRTHSSNKRLRKDDSSGTNSPITPPLAGSVTSGSLSRSQLGSSQIENAGSRFEPTFKRARLNGETSNYSNFNYATDPSNNNVVSGTRGTTNSTGVTFASPPNQKVPSPRETDKTINDRLSDVATSRNDSNIREAIITDPVLTTPQASLTSGPKKRGRKKGSKSVKNQSLPEDCVKEKLASISRNPKLKTTQELLADLQARGANTGTHFTTGMTTTTLSDLTTGTTTTTTASSRNSETHRVDVLRNNDEHSSRSRAKRDKTNLTGDDNRKNRDKRFPGKHWDTKKSDLDEDDDDDDDSENEEQTYMIDHGRTKELTVEEILAKLPPLDRDAISWSDCENDGNYEINDEEEDDEAKSKRDITDKDVERLHDECVEGLNGNFQLKIHDPSKEDAIVDRPSDDDQTGIFVDEITSKCVYRRFGGKENDREFREWHEMLARPSYEGQTLHILPYVIID